MVKFCPKDGSLRSDDETVCPYCGTPLDEKSQKKTEYKPILFLILVGILVVISFFLAMYLIPINYSSIRRFLPLAAAVLGVVLLGSFIKKK
jgi:uncharacterized membrane protein YvbJ